MRFWIRFFYLDPWRLRSKNKQVALAKKRVGKSLMKDAGSEEESRRSHERGSRFEPSGFSSRRKRLRRHRSNHESLEGEGAGKPPRVFCFLSCGRGPAGRSAVWNSLSGFP